MKKLTNLIKNTDPKKIVVLGVATAIGTAKGVKIVAAKHKEALANSDVKKKAAKVVSTTLATGSKVVGEIKEDLNTVAGAVKDQSANTACARCKNNEPAKPCCKETSGCNKEECGKNKCGKTAEAEVTLPEPVKADDVVAANKEADLVAEAIKNTEAKAEEVAKNIEKKTAATRKPRAPRTAKANAKPVAAKEDATPDVEAKKETAEAKPAIDAELGEISDAETKTPEKSE